MLALAVLIGCGLLSLSAAARKTDDAAHPYASSRPMPEPVIFGEGLISTADDELNACFAPDGKTLFISKSVGNRMGVIVVSKFEKGKWSRPEVAEFSGRYSDYDPFISPDGSHLFFISTRPVDSRESKPKKDYDIWEVEKTKTGWGEPKNLGAPINTDKDEFYPSVASDGTLYFSALKDAGKGSFDVYRSRFVDGKYSEPENLGDAINGKTTEVDNYIAPDQSFLVFASYGRPDSLGSGDLYISYNRNGAWTPARHLGSGINSSAREYCPIGSPDGKYFFFTSLRGFVDQPQAKRLTYQELTSKMHSTLNGLGNIYQVDISALSVEEKGR
jgi:Tol biopolymer transport system component